MFESKWYATWKYRHYFNSESCALEFCLNLVRVDSRSDFIKQDKKYLHPYGKERIFGSKKHNNKKHFRSDFPTRLRASLLRTQKGMSDDWKIVYNLFSTSWRSMAPATASASASALANDRFNEALEFARSCGHCTNSGLRKKMGIGYDQAKNFMDRMTAMGLLSQPGYPGSTRPRKFLVPASLLAPAPAPAPAPSASTSTVASPPAVAKHVKTIHSLIDSAQAQPTYLDILLQYISMKEITDSGFKIKSGKISSDLTEKEIMYCREYDKGSNRFFRGNVAEICYSQLTFVLGKGEKYFTNVSHQIIEKMSQPTGSKFDCKINGALIDVKSVDPNNPTMYRVGHSDYYILYNVDTDKAFTKATATLLGVASLKTIKAHSKILNLEDGVYELDINKAREDMLIDFENFLTDVFKLTKLGK